MSLVVPELRTSFLTRVASSNFLVTGDSWLRSLVTNSLTIQVACAAPAMDLAWKPGPACASHTDAVWPRDAASLVSASISSSQFLPVIAMPE